MNEKSACGCEADTTLVVYSCQILPDNELPCQKAENYPILKAVLHHGALIEAL